MDETTRKGIIIKALTKMECIPVSQEKISLQEFSKVPLSQIASFGTATASVVPILKSLFSDTNASTTKETLYKMIDPTNGEGIVDVFGNIRKQGKTVIYRRAKYVKVDEAAIGAATKVNPYVMMIAVAISVITKKLDKIEEAQREIIEFLQLKEKAKMKGNVAVLQETLEDYKYNWDNSTYKTNKHIQVQEIRREAEQSIIFIRDRIEKMSDKKKIIHSDRDVQNKMQKIQKEFNDYELSMYIFAFSSFLEVMLLENFDSGYLEGITKRIEMYLGQYKDLHKACYKKIKKESETSVQTIALKGVAGLNKGLGKGIEKIPKISEGQADEKLLETSEKVGAYSKKRVESAMETFSKEECACVTPFLDNIRAVNMIYNEPLELLFDSEYLYFRLTEATE